MPFILSSLRALLNGLAQALTLTEIQSMHPRHSPRLHSVILDVASPATRLRIAVTLCHSAFIPLYASAPAPQPQHLSQSAAGSPGTRRPYLISLVFRIHRDAHAPLYATALLLAVLILRIVSVAVNTLTLALLFLLPNTPSTSPPDWDKSGVRVSFCLQIPLSFDSTCSYDSFYSSLLTRTSLIYFDYSPVNSLLPFFFSLAHCFLSLLSPLSHPSGVPLLPLSGGMRILVQAEGLLTGLIFDLAFRQPPDSDSPSTTHSPGLSKCGNGSGEDATALPPAPNRGTVHEQQRWW
ncbi:hypothetical protein K438DRAFT_1977952 [Mycena galopus ATCC 62051]|nr:hypothetical protein K438DRAFT_1977952 [Mycena galopus ATCC 62051]